MAFCEPYENLPKLCNQKRSIQTPWSVSFAFGRLESFFIDTIFLAMNAESADSQKQHRKPLHRWDSMLHKDAYTQCLRANSPCSRKNICSGDKITFLNNGNLKDAQSIKHSVSSASSKFFMNLSDTFDQYGEPQRARVSMTGSEPILYKGTEHTPEKIERRQLSFILYLLVKILMML